ncbi:MAG: Gfo/Idh/MocA family oxidoreductase [Candidatus Eisenbacteria bacterium]|nr:Gfo/Idh/MocA family oxidoreductase [Candidatus Eisenbacteria bacterium]
MSRFRVAILGTGFGRSVQAPGFQRHPGFDLVAIAGSRPEKTRRIADQLGIPEAFDDWRQLLDQAKPDLVSIATPADLHHPMMLEALARGAHVLCEKPTALHRFQAAEMRDRARSLGRLAGINHEFRFFPARRLALRLAREGAIGTARRGEILGRYPIWPTPQARGPTWLSEQSRGGGILGALGSHHTDCFRTFFGEPESVLASVRVDQPRRGPTPAEPESAIATADDGCTLEYRFANGATGLIDLSATAPYRWERFEIHGSTGSLRWDETGYRLWHIAAGSDPEEIEIPAELRLSRREGDPALAAPFAVLVDGFHRALLGEGRLDPDFQDAVAVQSALDAARASNSAGARMRVEIPAAIEAR